MVAMITRQWSRHARANRILDLIQGYAAQGKEPPPELVKSLQYDTGDCGRRRWRRAPEERLGRAFLFAALAFAFGFMAFMPQYDGENMHMHHGFGMVLITAIFAACALSNLMTFLMRPRDLPPYDKDGQNR
jgi:hypothetical protein